MRDLDTYVVDSGEVKLTWNTKHHGGGFHGRTLTMALSRCVSRTFARPDIENRAADGEGLRCKIHVERYADVDGSVNITVLVSYAPNKMNRSERKQMEQEDFDDIMVDLPARKRSKTKPTENRTRMC